MESGGDLLDDSTTLAVLKARVHAFCAEREWDPFHGPKDLAIGIVTEGAELLEHFRFRGESESLDLLADPARRAAVEEELSDVLFFLLRFAGRFDIDLASAFGRKLQRNAERYPVDKARGRNAKYSEL